MKPIIILALLPLALGAEASCVPDPPEMGDIGPGSGLVCQQLMQRHPGTALAVVGRSIRSPSDVSIQVSVDGRPVVLAYRLTGFTWRADDSSSDVAEAGPLPARLSPGH